MTDNLNNEMEIKQNKEDKLEIQKELDMKDENEVKNELEVKLEDKFLDAIQSVHEPSTACTTNSCYTRTQCIETMEQPPTGDYPVKLYNQKEDILKRMSLKPFLVAISIIVCFLSVFINNLSLTIILFGVFIFVLHVMNDEPYEPKKKMKIYEKLETSNLLLDTLNKKIKLAPKYSIEIHEYLEFAIKVENEIEKIRSNISNIFTENELITNGKDVQKQCDIVDEHNKKISYVLSKLNNELADKILKQ